jgi:hypothetical protein
LWMSAQQDKRGPPHHTWQPRISRHSASELIPASPSAKAMSDKNEEMFMEDDHSDRDLEDNGNKYDDSSSDGEERGEGDEAPSTFHSRQWPQSYRYCSILT